VGWSNKLFKKL